VTQKTQGDGEVGRKKKGRNTKRNISLGKQENKARSPPQTAKQIKLCHRPKEPIPCTKKVRQPTVIYKPFLNLFIEEGCSQRKKVRRDRARKESSRRIEVAGVMDSSED